MGQRNDLRWDCKAWGCFNVKARPKIQLLSELLPGKMAFSDIDGATEYKCQFLGLEWKSEPAIKGGQDIMFLNLTRTQPWLVLAVAGDAETMRVDYIKPYWRGVKRPWVAADFLDLQNTVKKWVRWVDKHPL